MTTETEALTALEAVFAEDLPCEDSHGGDKNIHDDGPGVWYITDRCPECGDIVTVLRCAKLASLVFRGEVRNICLECGYTAFDARDFTINAVKR